MESEGGPVTRAMFERNLGRKIGDAQFNADMSAILRLGFDPVDDSFAGILTGPTR